MERRDLHTHTLFSDGENTAREMVQAAIEIGLTAIGITDHSHTPFDESYCMQKDNIPVYRAELARLREEYRDRITVLCGIEQDYYADVPCTGYDCVIGSVHYLKFGETYVAVDEDAERLLAAGRRYCGGDIYAVLEEYYRTVADVVHKTGASLIGHFDLISRMNQQTPFFDEQHPRYRAAWRAAADALLKTGVPFEVNTGACRRGYRSVPYPPPEIQHYIREHGGKLVFSSDSHSVADLIKANESAYI